MRTICYVLLVLVLSINLHSCGGGSTVTAISVEPESNNVPLGGSTTITAKSSKSIVDNVTGEKVRFSFRANESGATLDVINDRLDGNGEAKVIYRAGTRPGNDVVQVSFDSGATGVVQIRVGPAEPVAPLEVSQIGTNTVRVTFKDTWGLPISGAHVLLSIDIGQLGSTSGTTNSNGVFETNFSLPSGVNSAQVTATIQGISASTEVSTSDRGIARIQLSQRGSKPGDGGAIEVEVQARAFDSSNRPVENIRLNFSIRGAGSVSDEYKSTDVNGVALITVSLPVGVNSTSLVAVSGNITQNLTVTRQSTQLSSIELEQFDFSIFATAIDSAGTPLQGVLLNFQITPGTIGDPPPTNENGITETKFALPEGVDTARVMASSGSVSATLDVVVVRPERSRINAGKFSTPQGLQAGSLHLETEGSSVRAWVYDHQGNPLEDKLLSLDISSGTLTQTRGVTNVNGLFETTITLPAEDKEALLTAECDGISITIVMQ